jgi:hypothetical protein
MTPQSNRTRSPTPNLVTPGVFLQGWARAATTTSIRFSRPDIRGAQGSEDLCLHCERGSIPSRLEYAIDGNRA